jgi:hypothetical protein
LVDGITLGKGTGVVTTGVVTTGGFTTGFSTIAGVVQAANKPKLIAKGKIRIFIKRFSIGVRTMWLLALEACGATLLFIFFVWWTMFSGRKPEKPKQPTLTKEEKEN